MGWWRLITTLPIHGPERGAEDREEEEEDEGWRHREREKRDRMFYFFSVRLKYVSAHRLSALILGFRQNFNKKKFNRE